MFFLHSLDCSSYLIMLLRRKHVFGFVRVFTLYTDALNGIFSDPGIMLFSTYVGSIRMGCIQNPQFEDRPNTVNIISTFYGCFDITLKRVTVYLNFNPVSLCKLPERYRVEVLVVRLMSNLIVMSNKIFLWFENFSVGTLM